ncbi:hypothetical protein [Methylocystis sp. B8]|uniref:hypothetical protein n=1 Tax=Methylocystis sp. B8 TaxID=544938 RepID=UPI0010FDF8D1|nr:hypothetical protein [Methylocystis sp. B8]TLG71611.1 hypothetical protein FEV16_15830 [Methylocystis sp. B8]
MNHFSVKTLLIVAALAAMILPANAKPKIASGSNCNSNWVNNSGAMACFIQGEEETRAGARHPHYVACAGGDIFCCQDNDSGAQNCIAQAKSGLPSRSMLAKALRAAQRARLKQ